MGNLYIKPRQYKTQLCAVVACGALWSALFALADEPIAVANHSFEAPQTFFAYPDAEEWEETGPVSEDPQLPGVIDTLDTGVFFNSPVDEKGQPSPFFIPNADGSQVAFIFAKDDDDIAFFQQLDVPFEVGARYALNVMIGESYFFPPLTYNPNDPDPPPDPDPALLAVRVYYDDTGMVRHSIAQRVVSTDEMPDGPDTGVLLVDMAATTGLSLATDSWIGEPIGIEIRPIDGLSGVWNLDNARVSVECDAASMPGDADLDGDVDDADSALLPGCMTGPGVTARPTGCPPCAFQRLDADADGDLDLRDYAAMMANVAD